MMAKEFEVNDFGVLRHFLGMEFAIRYFCFSKEITLDLLEETCMLGYKPSKTPIELGNNANIFVRDWSDWQRNLSTPCWKAHLPLTYKA